MIKPLKFFLALLVVLIFIPASINATTNTDRFIIVYETEIDESLLEEYSERIHKRIDSINAIVVDIPPQLALSLETDSRISSVEKDAIVTIDLSQQTNWGIDHINVPTLWNKGLTGRGVKVAVIDTGTSNHADLVIKDGISTVAYTSLFQDDHGHGTHTAGIIAGQNLNGRIVGVAPNVELYVIKALDSFGNGKISEVVAGIDWAISQGVDIINLSLGTDGHQNSLAQILDIAYQNDILIVASVGNNGTKEGTENLVQYPAKYPTVIAVGATDSQNKRTYFSATGKEVEIVAPGVYIYSTYKNNDYLHMSGTSMAAPFVTGTLALLKEAFPNKTNHQLRQLLIDSAIDLGVDGRDPWYGYGLIEVPDLTFMHSVLPTVPKSVLLEVDYTSMETPKVQLAWEPVYHLSGIKHYNIYRNGYLFKTVDGGATSFEDLVAIPGLYTYQVSAVSTSDKESAKSKLLSVQVESLFLQTFVPETFFSDVGESHWAADHIYFLVNEKIIKGYDDGSFKENNHVTRGQVAVMIGLALGLDGTMRETVFTDIGPEHPYSGFIQAAYEAEVIKGHTDGTFRAHEPITRGHIAIMIDQAFDLDAVPIAPFTDVLEVTPGFSAINKLAYYGIAKGYDDGTYKPFNHTTRAQFSVLMTNTSLHSSYLSEKVVEIEQVEE